MTEKGFRELRGVIKWSRGLWKLVNVIHYDGDDKLLFEFRTRKGDGGKKTVAARSLSEAVKQL